MKLRPVLLLTGPIGSFPEVLVAYISSVIPTQPLSSDLILSPGEPEFRSTQLKTISALRLHKSGINEDFELYPMKQTDLSIFPERIMFRNDTEVEKFYASTSII